jgi:imidazolonepropionase-like amidohydrolase
MRVGWLLLPLLFAPAGETIAIVDARIVIDAHTQIDKGTILIRNGLIEAVGEKVEVPANAEVIKGLVVYPGFIDAHATVGLGDTKRTPEQRKTAEDEPFDYAKAPPLKMDAANRKGIRPELSVAEIVNVSAEDSKTWTAAGFTTAHILIGEEYLAGPGALVSMSGQPRRLSIVRPSTVFRGGFKSYGDGYPSTTFGVLAHLRQVLMDAQRYPELKQRRPFDPALEALQPLLRGEAAVAFEANSPTEIGRVFKLADEFGLKVIITGGAEAWKAADELKRRDVVVILSLKPPLEPKEPKHDPEYELLEKPKKLKDEERREYEELLDCALRLHEKGVRFCFSTLGTNPKEAWGQLQKLLERKLPHEAALRALTATPAEVFGVSRQLGSIEVGKIASLTVLTKPLGQKGAKPRFVFVEGKKFDLEEEGKGKPEVNVGGTWKAKVGEVELTLELKQKGAEVTGKAVLKGNEIEVTGTVSGKGFRMKAGELSIKGEMEEDQLTGTASGMGLEGEFSASRPKK